MARWDPDAVGRLQQAAMELYRDPGYDQVTVAEIATRAGLTRRTFFRYFADKREVLFFGTDRVETLVVEGLLAAPEGASPLAMVAEGLAVVWRLSEEEPRHAEYARQRHGIIQANAELRERELTKHASLARAMAAALRTRGVDEPAASLAAEAGLLGFKVGFERWVEDPARGTMGKHVRAAMKSLASVVVASKPRKS